MLEARVWPGLGMFVSVIVGVRGFIINFVLFLFSFSASSNVG